MKRPALLSQAGRSFTNGFSGPKSFRDFRGTGPRFRNKGAPYDGLFPRFLSFPLELGSKVKVGREIGAFLLALHVTEQIKGQALLRRQESIQNAVISLLSVAKFL